MAHLRERAGLSYRALETVTGIKYSALAAMQMGSCPVAGTDDCRSSSSGCRLTIRPV